MTFRPRTGDYFFIMEQYEALMRQLTAKVSVPVLGIIFLPNWKNEIKRWIGVDVFPPPHWGLFFYHRKTFKETWAVAVAVSVPVLGIIFLSTVS